MLYIYNMKCVVFSPHNAPKCVWWLASTPDSLGSLQRSPRVGPRLDLGEGQKGKGTAGREVVVGREGKGKERREGGK